MSQPTVERGLRKVAGVLPVRGPESPSLSTVAGREGERTPHQEDTSTAQGLLLQAVRESLQKNTKSEVREKQTEDARIVLEEEQGSPLRHRAQERLATAGIVTRREMIELVLMDRGESQQNEEQTRNLQRGGWGRHSFASVEGRELLVIDSAREQRLRAGQEALTIIFGGNMKVRVQKKY